MIRDRLMDPSETSSMSVERGPARFSPFLVGAIAGAAVALLFAPMAGRDSRARLKDGLRHRLGRAQDKLEEGAHAVRDAVQVGKETVRETVSAARAGFDRSLEERGLPGTSVPGSTAGSRKV